MSESSLSANLTEAEAHMVEVFRPMDRAVDRIDVPFGGGYRKHEAAREAAPEWFRRWDDEHRWVICFTQGWDGLVSLASGFGWSKETLLHSLIAASDAGADK